MKPTKTRQNGQRCLICGQLIAVGELAYTTQTLHSLGRVHIPCKPALDARKRERALAARTATTTRATP